MRFITKGLKSFVVLLFKAALISIGFMILFKYFKPEPKEIYKGPLCPETPKGLKRHVKIVKPPLDFVPNVSLSNSTFYMSPNYTRINGRWTPNV